MTSLFTVASPNPMPHSPLETTPDEALIPSHPNEVQTRLFVTLWAMAFSSHYFEEQPFDAWPVLLAAIPCLLFPESVAAFGALVFVGTGVVWMHLPASSNHLVLALFIHLILIGAGGIAMMRTKPSWKNFLPTLISRAVVPVTLVVLVIYFYAVFHKLNRDFFDPEVSCSGRLLRQSIRLLGLTPGSIPAKLIFTIALLTVVVEALLLILIAVGRTRSKGVLLGVAFHFILASAKFYDFSTFVFALYVLILAPHSAALVPQMERWRTTAVAGWLLFGFVSFAADTSGDLQSPVGLTWHTLQVATWASAVGPIMLPLLIADYRHRPAPWAWKPQPVWLLIFPLLAFLNGAAPYLGFKTVGSYSMFSNLHTEEGRTNHLLGVVGSMQMTRTLSDTVDVLEIKVPADPELGWFERARGGTYWLGRQMRWTKREGTLRIPWLELRRAAHVFKDADIQGVFVRYRRGDEIRQVADIASDPVLTAPLPSLSKHLLAFREIERGDRPVVCRW